jgi:hypothetical protein
MNYLLTDKSGTAQRLIEDLKQDNQYEVVISESVGETYLVSLDNKAEINWNPNIGLSPKSGGVISSSVALSHELVHAWAHTKRGEEKYSQWKEDVKALNPDLIISERTFREEFATSIERIIGEGVGEKAHRKNYMDVLIDSKSGLQYETRVPSPTFHIDP